MNLPFVFHRLDWQKEDKDNFETLALLKSTDVLVSRLF